jgi:hypothetical protein
MSNDLRKLVEQSLNGENDTFCAAPFFHMYVHSAELPKVCCVYRSYEYYTWEDKKDYIESGDRNLQSEWNNSYYRTVRKELIQGKKHKGCETCWSTESHGGISDRVIHNKRLSKYLKDNPDIEVSLDIKNGSNFESPINLDLRPGNLCNLQCRMCGPGSSSQLNKEWSRFPKDWGFPKFDSRQLKSWDSDDNLNFILRKLPKNKIGSIKFLGGEPTLMPEVHKIMDKLLEDDMRDVELFFTSNMTNINNKFLEQISKFNNIKIAISADGIGSVLEYIRHPINWDSFVENVSRYAEISGIQHDLDIQYTIQAYNINNILPTLLWIDNFNETVGKKNSKRIVYSPEILHHPIELSYRALPKSYRDHHIKKCLMHPIMKKDFVTKYGKTIEKLEIILDDKREDDPIGFINHTVLLDISRKQHLKNYIPEVYNLYSSLYDNHMKKRQEKDNE